MRATGRALRRSRLVLPRQRASFLRREATKQPIVGSYSLVNENDAVVFLRHDVLDTWTLEEIFGLEVYALPEPVRRRFAARSGDIRVLDLGANIGLVALFLSLRLGRCSGTAFEPDPQNAELLERLLAANGLTERWDVVKACAGNRHGVVNFLHGNSVVSHTVDEASSDTIEVSVHDVLDDLGRADLAKLDIEGAEWQVLTDKRFSANAPAAIVVEYHEEHCPSDDPRGLMLEILGSAGYETYEVEIPANVNLPVGQGVVWGWRGAG